MDNLQPNTEAKKPWEVDPFAFKSTHKRLAWLLRLSSMTNVALASVVIILASAISSLMPLKEVRPALLRVDTEDNRIYRVEPISTEVDGFYLLLEQLAKRYVRLILAIDDASQTERFQEAWVYTEDSFYKKFHKERIESGEVRKAISSGLTRSIVVESADKISERKGEYRYAVDFVQIDKRKGKEIDRKKVRAYLVMTLKPHEVVEAEKYENPLGIRIVDMSLKEKELK